MAPDNTSAQLDRCSVKFVANSSIWQENNIFIRPKLNSNEFQLRPT